MAGIKARGHRDELVLNDSTGELQSLVGDIEMDLLGVPEIVGALKAQKNGTGRRKPRLDWKHKMWGLLDTEVFAKLELTPTEVKVFAAIADAVYIEDNVARISQAGIARAIGVNPSNVSRTLRSLVERRIITKLSKDRWKVTPWLYYRGSAAEWELATEHADEPVYA